MLRLPAPAAVPNGAGPAIIETGVFVMLKVLLLDDKKSIIEGMKELIDWESCGFEIAAALGRTDEALKFVRENHVDLLITDIRMPHMSGLELIEEVKKFKPHLRFAIISGYAEFEYVKQALNRKVDGYLLKPVDEDELIEVLDRVKKEIEEEKIYFRRKLDEYIRRIFSGETGTKPELDRFDDSGSIRYILIRPFDDKRLFSAESHADVEAASRAFEIMTEEYGENKSVYIGKSDAGDIEVIVDSNEYGDNILRYCLEISERLGDNFAILVGRQVDDIENIRESRESVKEVKNACFYETDRKILIYENCNLNFSNALSGVDFCRELVSAVKNAEAEELTAQVLRLCGLLRAENVHPDTVMMYIYNVIFEVENKVSGSENEIVKFFYRYSVFKKSPLINFNMLQAFISDMAVELRRFMEDYKEKNTFGVVGEIVDYINENYAQPDLKLQTVADKYYVNSGYLGKLFTERVGVRFNTYLLKIRIEKSKELLKNSNLKIYEIAQKVGFNDPNYFSVKFAELENVTPAAYREKNR